MTFTYHAPPGWVAGYVDFDDVSWTITGTGEEMLAEMRRIHEAIGEVVLLDDVSIHLLDPTNYTICQTPFGYSGSGGPWGGGFYANLIVNGFQTQITKAEWLALTPADLSAATGTWTLRFVDYGQDGGDTWLPPQQEILDALDVLVKGGAWVTPVPGSYAKAKAAHLRHVGFSRKTAELLLGRRVSGQPCAILNGPPGPDRTITVLYCPDWVRGFERRDDDNMAYEITWTGGQTPAFPFTLPCGPGFDGSGDDVGPSGWWAYSSDGSHDEQLVDWTDPVWDHVLIPTFRDYLRAGLSPRQARTRLRYQWSTPVYPTGLTDSGPNMGQAWIDYGSVTDLASPDLPSRPTGIGMWGYVVAASEADLDAGVVLAQHLNYGPELNTGWPATGKLYGVSWDSGYTSAGGAEFPPIPAALDKSPTLRGLIRGGFTTAQARLLLEVL